MAKNPRSSGLDKTYVSLRFGVTDKPLTETEEYESIPPVERERRIRYILYGGYEDSRSKGLKSLAANLQEEDLNNIPDESAKLWKDLISEACTVAGKGEKVWAIGYFHYDPKTILALMVKYAVLPKNPSENDVGRFIAGRAALAHWMGFEYLSDLETVPYAAAEWWKRYIAHPNKGDSNSTKDFNIITECGLLITARMLSRFFSEEEFLFMAMERAHICSCLDIEFSNGMGDTRYWELTSTGIETAERMGLFAIFDKVSNTGNAGITTGAGAVPGKTESRTKRTATRRKGGNKPKRIWQKLLVKACIEKKKTGTADIVEILKDYLDEMDLLDDEGSIVSEINYQDVRHDSDYVTSGKFDAFLKKNRNNKKLIGGNDAETKTFKAWLSKNYKH